MKAGSKEIEISRPSKAAAVAVATALCRGEGQGRLDHPSHKAPARLAERGGYNCSQRLSDALIPSDSKGCRVRQSDGLVPWRAGCKPGALHAIRVPLQ